MKEDAGERESGVVPEGHLLQKIDAAVDFNRIYDMMKSLYSEDKRMPKYRSGGAVQNDADPASVWTAVTEADGAGGFWDTRRRRTPHFSTVSYNFRHRFAMETVDEAFAWILEEVAEFPNT